MQNFFTSGLCWFLLNIFTNLKYEIRAYAWMVSYYIPSI